MKPYERRQAAAYPAFRLAVWSDISFTYMENRKLHESVDAAKLAAKKPGKYRLTKVDIGSQEVLEDFTV